MADKPKTIADLGDTKPRIKVGKNMIENLNKLQERVRQLEAMRKEEQEVLEAGGYDYDGHESWARAMERLGRR